MDGGPHAEGAGTVWAKPGGGAGYLR